MIILLITALGLGLVIGLTKFNTKGLMCQLKKSANVAFYNNLRFTPNFVRRKYTKQVGILFDLRENNDFDLTIG